MNYTIYSIYVDVYIEDICINVGMWLVGVVASVPGL